MTPLLRTDSILPIWVAQLPNATISARTDRNFLFSLPNVPHLPTCSRQPGDPAEAFEPGTDANQQVCTWHPSYEVIRISKPCSRSTGSRSDWTSNRNRMQIRQVIRDPSVPIRTRSDDSDDSDDLDHLATRLCEGGVRLSERLGNLPIR